MAPFSSKAVITFEEIPVSKTARRFLIIENPTDEPLHVQLTCKHTQKPIKNLQFEWLEGTVPAAGETTVEITWTPAEVVACKETFFVTDQRGFRKELYIVFKSMGQGKTTAAASRKPLRARGNFNGGNLLTVNASMRLRTPSPPHKKRVTGQRVSPLNDPPYKAQKSTLMAIPNRKTTPKRATAQPPMIDYNSQLMMDDKENSPVYHHRQHHQTSMNASDIFKNIQFTPAGDRDRNARGLDYMASLPTPKLGEQHNNVMVQQHHGNVSVLTSKKIVWSPIFEGIREEARLSSRQSLAAVSVEEYNVKTPEIVVTAPEEVAIQSVSDIVREFNFCQIYNFEKQNILRVKILINCNACFN